MQTCQYWFVGIAFEVLEDQIKEDCFFNSYPKTSNT